MRGVGKKVALEKSQKEYLLAPSINVSRDLSLSIRDVYSALHDILHRSLHPIRKQARGLKFQLRCKILLEKYSYENEHDIVVDVWFPAETRTVTTMHEIPLKLQKSVGDMMSKFDAFVHQGSGWVVKQVKTFSLNVNQFILFSGGSFCSSLPLRIKRSRSCISIGNSCDDKCFLKCVVAALCNKEKNVGRWCGMYDRVMSDIERLSSGFLTFPVTTKVIKKFENEWPISINVYGFSGVIYPQYLSSHLLQSGRFNVNLLLHSGHYYLIRNMSSLVAPQCKKNKRRCHVCPSCLSYFVQKDRYDTHVRLCKKDGTQYVFPEEDEAGLSFSSFNSMVNAPFVIYADLETMIKKEVMVKKGKTRSKRKHVPVSVGALSVCKDRPEFGSAPFLYTGRDCIDMLMRFFHGEVCRMRQIYDNVLEPCIMTDSDEEKFASSKRCEMCGGGFGKHSLKVRDHCHISGKFRFALCSNCNLTRAKRPFQVYVFFHGLSNYDSHFLIQKLGEYKRYPVSVIPRNSERYMSFSLGCMKFKDSYQFLQCSLATLVENLASKGDGLFNNLKLHVPEKSMRDLLMRKGIFPYSFFSRLAILNHTHLPNKEAFRNDLDGTPISSSDYEHAQTVWDVFKCETFKDYLHVYLLCDVLHLADVFEAFRDKCLADYRLDPAHYFSSPHFTYDAFLLSSGVQLELLTEINQYFFLERGIRGGLSMVAKRYAKANHPNIPGYDSSLPHTFILDLDSNNLYGKAMQEYLPYGGFRWMGPEELTQRTLMGIAPDAAEGCFVECTLDYPEALHDLHADYPLAPVKTKITYDSLSPYCRFLCDRHKLKHTLNTLKLLTTFRRRSFYVLHYRNFQLYVKLGLRVVAIHSALAFRQAPYMKGYVDMNVLKRAASTNKFDADFYKLSVNSLFGKTIENPEKRTKVKLCRTKGELEKKVGHYSFKRSKIINKNLVGVEMRNTVVKMNKPFYVGNAVLELSKFHMYNFHYNVMKPVFNDRIHLLYTDTDSLMYEIQSENPYQELKDGDKLGWFDFSNYPKDHPLFDDRNKRVPGLFKDECNVRYIKEFVGLRSKMYSLSVEGEDVKVAKGVKKSVINNELRFSNYLDCLLGEDSIEHSFKCIRSTKHSVHTLDMRKKTLSGFDDKRFLLNAIDSVPYGYKYFKCEKVADDGGFVS